MGLNTTITLAGDATGPASTNAVARVAGIAPGATGLALLATANEAAARGTISALGPTTGSSIQKALAGDLTSATAGQDYVAPISVSNVLKGDGSGGLADAGGDHGMLADTGWTANADAGDKTQVIPSSGTLASFVAALDLVAAGLGSAFQAVAEKTKALETAGIVFKVPNA